jgi:hypothetical protein
VAPKSKAFIPNAPDELTPEWITAALRSAGAQGAVTGLTVEPLSGGGIGMTGQTVRVRLERSADADRIPETVVAKFAASDPQTRGLIEVYDSYAREIRFYQRYADRMPVRVPTYFGADYDPGSSGQAGPVMRRFIDALPVGVKIWISKNTVRYMRPSKRRYALLIEDMGAFGSVHDLTSPPDDAQVAAALEVFAAIHARFWNDASLAGDDTFDVITTTTPRLLSDVARRRALPLASDRYGWLGDEERVRLLEACDRFGDDLACMNQPVTLVHGDPRTDNLMYTPDGSVILLDWALAANGHPGWDVGYLLSSCLGRERIDARDALVAGYEDALASHGVAVDGAGLREAIDAAYRVVAVQQLLALSILEGTDDMTGAEMADLWLPRLAAGLTHRWA